MSQQVCFQDLFLDYTPPEPLREAVGRMAVVQAEIDRPARSIRLRLTSEVYITEKNLELVRAQVAERYGLKNLELAVRYPPETLAQMDFYDLARIFKKRAEPAAHTCLIIISPRAAKSKGAAFAAPAGPACNLSSSRCHSRSRSRCSRCRVQR